jgi:gas vesicle protein
MPHQKSWYGLALIGLGTLLLVWQPNAVQGVAPGAPDSAAPQTGKTTHDGHGWVADLRQELERVQAEIESRIAEAQAAIEERAASLRQSLTRDLEASRHELLRAEEEMRQHASEISAAQKQLCHGRLATKKAKEEVRKQMPEIRRQLEQQREQLKREMERLREDLRRTRDTI